MLSPISEHNYGPLIRQFLENLTRFPGCHLRCPMPIHKGESTDQWDDVKKDICKKTSEMLTMMGIEHINDPLNFTIMLSLGESDTPGEKK